MNPAPSFSPAAPCGLVIAESRAPVPLEHVHVDADVQGFCARVTVRQRYRNRETSPLEVVYVFPLDESAAVCGFEAIVDGTRFVGIVKDREEAFRDYDDAMEAGHGAFLLDEERADVFTASLGNVRPGSQVDLVITYVCELGAEGPAVRFALPTTVSPRYAPAPDRQGVGRTAAEALNPPIDADVSYRLTFEMTATMPGPVTAIESPTHPISSESDGRRARVRLTQRDAVMDRDLVVLIRADGLNAPHALVERAPDGHEAAVVSFVPSFESAMGPADVVFLVDRSGSMGGTSIEEVRNALQLCLRSLPPGSFFDIVSFGSTHASLFAQSRPYDDQSLREASEFVAGIDADLGGTEILPALESVVRQRPAAGLSRQVVLLTDGEVTNTDAVILLARQHRATTRIFTFGIGAGASHHLVKAVARATGGASEFIAPGERIETKVMRMFKRVFSPALSGVRVAWPGRDVTSIPADAPPVFDGDRVLLYALAGAFEPGSLSVTGTRDGQPFAARVDLGDVTPAVAPLVGALAARARIREIEEQPEYTGARGSRQGRGRSDRRVADEIVALALRYRLCSRETSMVAIEHRETPATEQAQLRRIPVALTAGWGGHAHQLVMSPAPLMGDPRVRLSAQVDDYMDGSRLLAAKAVFASGAPSLSPPRIGQQDRATDRPLDRLVRLQRADGSWDLTDGLLRALGLSPDKVRQLLDDLRQDEPDPRLLERCLATALAMCWLEQQAASSRDEWHMLAEKARAWLSQHDAGTRPASWTRKEAEAAMDRCRP